MKLGADAAPCTPGSITSSTTPSTTPSTAPSTAHNGTHSVTSSVTPGVTSPAEGRALQEPAQGRTLRWPPLAWLALVAAALWPHWLWASRRLADGSDDPLGIAALAVLVWAVAGLAKRLRIPSGLGWAGVSGAGVLGATLAHLLLAPPLFALLLAALALLAALCAVVPPATPKLPLVGLAVLALPVMASMQFYAGYPLRLVTAEVSRWLLRALGHAVQRSGTTLQFGERLVIVDAPCSGVQMVWMAYFCACALAWQLQLPDRSFVRRLAGIGVLVLAGNVLRNSALVWLELHLARVPEGVHQGVGLAVLAGVCAAVLMLVHGGHDAR